MIDGLRRVLRPIIDKIKRLSTRGHITFTDDSKSFQTAQVRLLAGESRDNVDRIQNYGFSSRPMPDAECVFLALNGNRKKGVVIAADNRKYRFQNLENGELALYTHEGAKIHFKNGKIIDIECDTLNIKATSGVNIETPLVDMSAKLKTGDDIDGGNDINASNDVTAGNNVDASNNVSAGTNVEAGAMVSGPMITTGSGAVMSGSGVSVDGVDFNSHVHSFIDADDNPRTTNTPE